MSGKYRTPHKISHNLKATPLVMSPGMTSGGLENAVFLGTGGKVRALELVGASGVRTLWEDDLKGTGYNLVHLHYLKEKRLLFAATKGQIYSFDAERGSQVTHVKPPCLNNLVLSPDLMTLWHDGNLLLCASNSHVVALEPNNLNTIWERDLKSRIGLMHSYCIAPFRDRIYVGNAGRVFALSRSNGAILWENDLPSKGYNPVTIVVHPTSDILFVGTYGFILVVEATGGRTVREFNLEGTGYYPVTLNLDNATQTLFAATLGEMRGFGVEEGGLTERWKNKLSGMGRSYGHSIYIDELVFIGMYGKVCALHKTTGEETWQTSLPGCGYNFVTVASCNNPDILICGSMGKLYGLNRGTGEVLWRDDLSGLGMHEITISTETFNTEFNSSTLPQFLQSIRQRSS